MVPVELKRMQTSSIPQATRSHGNKATGEEDKRK